MMATLATAALVPVAIFLSLFFFYLISRHPALSAISAAVVVSIAWEVPNIPPLAALAGFQVYFLDILAVGLLVLTLARTSQMIRNIGFTAWIWLGLGAILFFAFARGASTIGLPEATSEFRAYLYPFASLGWAFSLDWDRPGTDKLVRRFALAIGYSLSLVAFYHISLHGLGSTSEFVSVNADTEQTSRALVAGQALMLLLSTIVCLHFWKSTGKRSYAWSAGLFTLVIILTQERTVWVAAAGAAIAVGLSGNTGVKRRTALVVALAAFFAFIAIASGALSPVIDTLVGAAQNFNTIEARMEGWTNLIRGSTLQGMPVVLFGEPFGQGYGRAQSGVWVTYAPHNWYLSLYLRSGIVGLILFTSFLIVVATRALRAHAPAASIAIVVVMIAFGWTYSWPWYVFVFIGWAIVPLTNRARIQDSLAVPTMTLQNVKGGTIA